MGEVYRNTYCTFSASLVCAESTGLFRKDDWYGVADVITSDMNGSNTTIRVFPSPMTKDRISRQNSLELRGWCFRTIESYL